MSGAAMERLYNLIPAIHRSRDLEQGEPLRALLGIIGEELGRIEADIDQLYDNWFIETCQEWVVPYIGERVGVRNVLSIQPEAFSLRPFIASTLAFRRRKGTPIVLEQVAQSVTGWPARSVEFFQTVSTAQHINHPRSGSVRTPDLRDINRLELLDGPFDRIPHTVDVRRIANRRGRYNLPNQGLFLWRQRSYPIVKALAPASGTGLYFFGQLGRNLVLFNPARTRSTRDAAAQEHHLPGPLRRRALQLDLEALRTALREGRTPHSLYFDHQPVVQIFVTEQVDGKTVERLIPADALTVADLSEGPPLVDIGATTYQALVEGQLEERTLQAAIDPVVGRLAFASSLNPQRVRVSYYYGFSSEIGGGMYDRRDALADRTGSAAYAVSGGGDGLETALAAWAADQPLQAVIEIGDCDRYTVGPLNVGEGQVLELRAANKERPFFSLSANWEISLAAGAVLRLNGLLISGGMLKVTSAYGAALELDHCTVVPTFGIDAAGAAEGSSLSLSRSISGPIYLTTSSGVEPHLSVRQCIIHGADPSKAPSTEPAPATALEAIVLTGLCTLSDSTVVGAVTATEIALMSNTIVTGAVTVDRRQQGCARFSYVGAGSTLPQQYHVLSGASIDTDLQEGGATTAVQPRFTSTRYGDAGYCQLRVDTAEALRRGADDGGELGVFHHLQQIQREDSLIAGLKEYLRFGLEAGIFYVT